MNKVVIIGAGPAGLFAADRLRSYGIKDITILDNEIKVNLDDGSFLRFLKDEEA